ncbi:MAG TPA: hypothetical protein VJJ53_01370 [Candidatus Nanoarchaeia archaeon]|nr:hypothetical protein [Candidatus Nanoarchaeia archaeon]
MKKISPKVILAIIFMLAILFQLFFALSTKNFSSDESYLNLRLTEKISENKFHLRYDNLSYGGRDLVYSPLFYYLLVFLSLIPLVFKIIPIIFSSLIVLIVYLISFELTKDEKVSLIASLMSAFIPVYFSLILNSLSIFSLAIPGLFFMLYCFIRIGQHKKYLEYFVVLSFILPLLHPIAFLLPISIMFYLILTITEDVEVSKLKKEVIIFSTFLTILLSFIIYKRAFLTYGFNVIWQNVPPQISGNYFSNINILKIIISLGILPLIYGIVGVVYSYFKGKKDSFFLINGVLLAVFLLLLLRLINLNIGLTFLGIALTILSAVALAKYFVYLRKTKFYNLENYLTVIIIVAVIILSIIPSYIASKNLIKSTITDEELSLFKEIKGKTPPGSTVLAPLEFGHLITYQAKRKNVADSNFLLAPNPEQRLLDIAEIYTTPFEVKALELLEKYDVDYIITNKKIIEKYNIAEVSYIKDEKCFKEILPEVFEVIC